MTGHSRAVETAVFAPTAPILVSDGYDGTIRFWPTETSHDADLVCTASAGTLTPAQWKLHLSGLPYNPPCP
ncbi:hypothetical protein ACFY1U_34430 [Streptomyces sp. NPDC001351]|uniref:hypothetical protein n=1 Tax=Streptomyces sp. NPDC001351 TaxID=3364564 RepID=UPI0036CCB943